MRRTLLALFVLSLLFFPTAVPSEESKTEDTWHLDGWSRRVTYTVSDQLQQVRGNIAKGLLYGRIELRTAGLDRDDGNDIRVVAKDGTPLRAWIGKRNNNGVRLIYCRPEKATTIHVYFGNPTAPVPETGIFKGEPSASSLNGLELSVYIAPFKLVDTAVGIDALTQNLKKLGTSAAAKVDAAEGTALVGLAPGAQQMGLLFVYRGFIHAPWDGIYYFGTDSQNPSFITIDGYEVAAWPGEHWKHGSYINGDTIHLRRGIHEFVYVNHRPQQRPILMSAGWMCPGHPDADTIPPSAFVKYALLTPVASHSAPGKELLDCEVIERFNISLNGSKPMTHIELKAFGNFAKSSLWTLERETEIQPGDPSLPYSVDGARVDLFLPEGGKWKVSLTNGSHDRVLMRFTHAKNPIVYPFYLDCEFDGLPTAVFRGLPFGALLNVPNETPLSPVVDFRVERLLDDKVMREAVCRKKMKEGVHVVTDVIFDPRKKESFSLPGLPFDFQQSNKVDQTLYDSVFRFTTLVNGHRISQYKCTFLSKDAPLPSNAKIDADGVLSVNGSKLVLVSEIEDASEYRRWAPIKGLTRLGIKCKNFLIVGESMTASGANGLSQRIAANLVEVGRGADFSTVSRRPYPFYSAVAPAMAKLETGNFDCLVLSLGFSDAEYRVPYSTLETLIHALADRAREKGIKRIVVLSPPLVPGLERVIRKYRDMVTDLCNRMRLDRIDLDPLFAGAFTREGNFTTLYPTEDALKSVAEDIAKRLSN